MQSKKEHDMEQTKSTDNGREESGGTLLYVLGLILFVAIYYIINCGILCAV